MMVPIFPSKACQIAIAESRFLWTPIGITKCCNCWLGQRRDGVQYTLVTLVDTDGNGVKLINQTEFVIGGVEYAVDCIIFASGLEVGTDFRSRSGFEIVGRDGRTLSQARIMIERNVIVSSPIAPQPNNKRSDFDIKRNISGHDRSTEPCNDAVYPQHHAPFADQDHLRRVV